MLKEYILSSRIQFIAEVKTCSPFGYQTSVPWIDLFQLANRIGDVISIHTDPRWGGSMEDISRACALTRKPILAKGIHKTDAEIIEALGHGAEYVLVVGRVPTFSPITVLEHCMIEPRSFAEISSIPRGHMLVWNSRDLYTGGLKKETVVDVRRVWDGWLCMASNIRTPEDVTSVPVPINAVLIGTHLASFEHNRGF